MKEKQNQILKSEEEMLLKDKILASLKAEDIIEKIEEDGIFAIRFSFRDGTMNGYAALRADATEEENKTNKVFGNDATPADKAVSLAVYLEEKKASGAYALAKKA